MGKTPSERLDAISSRLDHAAKEVVETAIGSSRIQMYRTIADQITEDAAELKELALEVKRGQAELRHG